MSVNFDERSTGFVWFFSFLVWFSQMEREQGDRLVLLLDDRASACTVTQRRTASGT